MRTEQSGYHAAIKTSVRDTPPQAWRATGRAPLEAARHVATAFRNLVDAWPDRVYEDGVVQVRLLGRRVTYVVDPECVRTLLVDDAHRLVRDDAMTRALSPALGWGC